MSKNETKQITGLAKAALFSIIPALFVFAVLEVAARILPPVQAPGERPAQFMGDVAVFKDDPLLKWRVERVLVDGYTLNSRGFRGKEFPSRPKKNGETRILVLGDSTSWGMGVGDDQVWPALLQKTLSRKKIFANPVVLNAATPGYTSFQGKLLFESETARYDADVIITYFGVNDASSRPGMQKDSQWKLPSMKLVPVIRLLRKSALYRDAAALSLKLKATEPTEATARKKQGYIQRVTPSEYAENLDAIKKLAGPDAIFLNIAPVWRFGGPATSDIEIVVFTKKGSYTVSSPEGPRYVYEPSVKLAEILNADGGDASKYFVDYCHLSPEGHMILAEETAEQLEDLLKNRK